MDMEFKCFICAKELNDLNLIIHHLRAIHSLQEKSSVIKCVVNSQLQCLQQFNTFQGLRKHVKSCRNRKKVSLHIRLQKNLLNNS